MGANSLRPLMLASKPAVGVNDLAACDDEDDHLPNAVAINAYFDVDSSWMVVKFANSVAHRDGPNPNCSLPNLMVLDPMVVSNSWDTHFVDAIGNL